MKLFPYLLCLLALSASAQVVNTLGLEGPAGGAPTFIIDQDFEETGLPTEGDPDYWSEVNATCDWDESTIVISGSQTLEVVGAATSRCQSALPSALDELWIAGRIRIDDGTEPQTRAMSIRTAASVEKLWLEINSDGADNELCFQGGTISQTCMSSTFTDDLNYYFWIHWSSSTVSLGISTDGTEPTSGGFFISASHSETDDIGIIQWRSASNCAACGIFYDDLLVDDEAIGDL